MVFFIFVFSIFSKFSTEYYINNQKKRDLAEPETTKKSILFSLRKTLSVFSEVTWLLSCGCQNLDTVCGCVYMHMHAYMSHKISSGMCYTLNSL